MVNRARDTLEPNKLYMDTDSSFHQIFTAPHLYEIRTLEPTLHGHCNYGTTISNKKGVYIHLFDIWPVRNGIAKLLLVPQIEKEGFCLTYDTTTIWTIQCPYGSVLNLKRDTCMCDKFPYLYLKKYKDTIVMIKTLRQNYEDYTKHDIK